MYLSYWIKEASEDLPELFPFNFDPIGNLSVAEQKLEGVLTIHRWNKVRKQMGHDL